MTDRELLELAARAIRLKIDKSPYNGGGACNTGFDASGNAVLDWHNYKTWNPLKDDDDALRLAVKLEIHVQPSGRYAWASTFSVTATEESAQDPFAATRRAIVRAAAEIGKAMSGSEK